MKCLTMKTSLNKSHRTPKALMTGSRLHRLRRCFSHRARSLPVGYFSRHGESLGQRHSRLQPTPIRCPVMNSSSRPAGLYANAIQSQGNARAVALFRVSFIPESYLHVRPLKREFRLLRESHPRSRRAGTNHSRRPIGKERMLPTC